jgi:hypothetical protein
MRDTMVESGEKDALGFVVIAVTADPLPPTEADGRQHQPPAAAAAVLHVAVSIFRENVPRHDCLSENGSLW